jgi:hypothetical protein
MRILQMGISALILGADWLKVLQFVDAQQGGYGGRAGGQKWPGLRKYGRAARAILDAEF